MRKLRPDGNNLLRPRLGARGKSFGGLMVRFALVLAAGTAVVLLTMSDGDEPASIQITGREEAVFDWSRDACEPIDIPDTPARAFRDANGNVQLIASSYVNRRMVGPDLNRLKQSCGVVLQSDYNANPATFSDRKWITSPYTFDGRIIFALVHDEYWGHTHPGRCSAGEYHPCWYNAITYAVSRDGGTTYSQPPAPSHLLAAVPYQYEPDIGPFGIFQPSNIVRSPDDGYFYSLVRAERFKEQKGGACLLRTRDLFRPDSWRAWDGDDFSVRFVNPYSPSTAAGNARDHVCEPVDPVSIAGMTQSLTYSTYFDKFLLIGTRGERGLKSGGIFLSLSDDLIDWSLPKLIRRVELNYTFECGDKDPIGHPSLLDPDSRSRNFDTVGREAYLYFTRIDYNKCKQTLNRDLLRVRVTFEK